MAMTTVYVELLDEGVSVLRPVTAERVGEGLYRLVGTPDETETWRFPPGDVVRCELRNGVLVAFEKAR
jgi:hypothetical protein